MTYSFLNGQIIKLNHGLTLAIITRNNIAIYYEYPRQPIETDSLPAYKLYIINYTFPYYFI